MHATSLCHALRESAGSCRSAFSFKGLQESCGPVHSRKTLCNEASSLFPGQNSNSRSKVQVSEFPRLEDRDIEAAEVPRVPWEARKSPAQRISIILNFVAAVESILLHFMKTFLISSKSFGKKKILGFKTRFHLSRSLFPVKSKSVRGWAQNLTKWRRTCSPQCPRDSTAAQVF